MTIDQVYNLNVRRGQVEEKLGISSLKIFSSIGEMGQLVVGMGNEL